MSDSDPPRTKLRWYQSSLRTLLVTTLVLSALLSFSIWLVGKIKTRNEVWEVVSINEEIVGTWNGEAVDGTPIGGALLMYTATCRAGDRTRTIRLTKESPTVRRDADLPLHRGDRFRIIQNPHAGDDADTVFLPGGVAVRTVPASE